MVAKIWYIECYMPYAIWNLFILPLQSNNWSSTLSISH